MTDKNNPNPTVMNLEALKQKALATVGAKKNSPQPKPIKGAITQEEVEKLQKQKQKQTAPNKPPSNIILSPAAQLRAKLLSMQTQKVATSSVPVQSNTVETRNQQRKKKHNQKKK
eukprot:105162_1